MVTQMECEGFVSMSVDALVQTDRILDLSSRHPKERRDEACRYVE
jgi:hypothetical protein